MIKQQRSVLDTVLDDAKRVSSKLNKEDQEKLGEYFQSVRDIETRIAKEEQWLDVPKAKPSTPIEKPDQEIKGYDENQTHVRHRRRRLESDATRVLTYRQTRRSLAAKLGHSIHGHNMSHYSRVRVWKLANYAMKNSPSYSPISSTIKVDQSRRWNVRSSIIRV